VFNSKDVHEAIDAGVVAQKDVKEQIEAKNV
jgi:hypothetical protein